MMCPRVAYSPASLVLLSRSSQPILLSSLLLAMALLLPAQHAQAQSTQELQQQIQQMKQLYEQQITALEGRIASLEQANRAAAHAAQEGTVSVTDLQAEVAKDVSAQEEAQAHAGREDRD